MISNDDDNNNNNNNNIYNNIYNYNKDGNVLFKDVLNIFYLRLYGVEHMLKDHSDIERENPMPSLYRVLFSISSKGSFICTIPDSIAHITDFCFVLTKVVEHCLEREIAQ